MVNQTEYWLKYWYNDASEGEGDDVEVLEVLDGYWDPPDEDSDDEILVTEGKVSAVKMGNIASQAKVMAKIQKEKESGGKNGNLSVCSIKEGFGIAQAMRCSMMPMVAPTIKEEIPVAEPEEPEPESYFSRLNSRIRVSLESSYGHPPLKRDNSEDADVEDNSLEERNCYEAQSASLVLYQYIFCLRVQI